MSNPQKCLRSVHRQLALACMVAARLLLQYMCLEKILEAVTVQKMV